jgi:hypothetical protein
VLLGRKDIPRSEEEIQNSIRKIRASKTNHMNLFIAGNPYILMDE